MHGGSVTRAAAKLGIAQPVVTAHLRSLEGRLGVKLVERDGRGIALTPAGQIVHHWAAEVVNQTHHVDALLEALTRDGSEALSVTTGINGASNGIADAIVCFQVDHPGTRLELSVLPTDDAVAAVLARESDFAVVSFLPGLILDPALQAQQLASDELILVAAPSVVEETLGTQRAHQAKRTPSRSVSAARLAELPFVCTPRGTARRPLIDAAMRERGVQERHIVMEVRSETAFHGAVRGGVGFALLSRRSMAEMLQRAELVEVAMPGGPIPLGIELVSRRDLAPRRLHKVFRDAVQAELLSRSVTQPSVYDAQA